MISSKREISRDGFTERCRCLREAFETGVRTLAKRRPNHDMAGSLIRHSHKTYYGISPDRPIWQAFPTHASWICVKFDGYPLVTCFGLPVISAIGECHSVVRRLHVRRQLRAQRRIVHVGVQIGQDRAPWFDPADPIQSLFQIEMAWMRAPAKRVDDP